MGYMTGDYSFREACASVGKGWLPLIRTAYKFKPDHIKIAQVKEKFGGLVIYTQPYDPEYTHILSTLASISIKTCEICGRRGKADTYRYWIKTLCKECRNKRRSE